MTYFSLLLSCGLAGQSFAGGSRESIRLITATELHANYAKYFVIDAREEKEFSKGRLPKSVNIDWRDWTLERPNFFNSLFGDPKRWGRVQSEAKGIQEFLSSLGLSNDTPVVIVGSPHGWGEEGRIAWNLLYWGAEDVALLDGGFSAWTSDPARQVEKPGETQPAVRGTFQLKLKPYRRAELPEVKKAVNDKKRPLIDVRAIDEFEGKTVSGQKRGGHLPGASFVPYRSLYREDGRYVSSEELQKLVSIPPGAEPITYCAGGVRSALLSLLIEIHFKRITANYDGSVWEWSAYPDLPLVKGSR